MSTIKTIVKKRSLKEKLLKPIKSLSPMVILTALKFIITHGIKLFSKK